LPERLFLAPSSRTETEGEGQQTVAYEPLAEPTINDRYLRTADIEERSRDSAL
jgi:hypothetical protein